MSKGNRQSMALLSVIAGSMWFIQDEKMFAVVKMKELTSQTRARVIEILEDWPEECRLDEKFIKMIDEWGQYLKEVKGYQTLPVMAKLARQCLADVKTKVRNKRKLELVDQLEEPLRVIDEFVDPGGRNFAAYEKASEMSSKLYEIIDWRW